MKFLHTADLHIGKRVRGFSLVEEQRHALDQIASIAARERVSAVLVAGDVFDKPVPPVEALDLLETFLAKISQAGIPCILIAGNHDSADRLAFGARFMSDSLVRIARPFSRTPQFVDLASGNECARIHLLPFVRPLHVKLAYPEEADGIATYTDALRVAVSHQPLANSGANILMAHQFVVDGAQGPATCDSETVSVGGLDSVEASVFDAFDYVALGHIHGAQRVRRDAVRYSGSLYPYSFSEAGRKKSCGIVEIDGRSAAGDDARFRSYTSVEFDEVRSLREVNCSFEELQAAAAVDPHADDYLHVTLTDPALMNAMERVRALYPHVMQLDFDTGAQAGDVPAARRARLAALDPIDLLEDFWQAQTGDALTSDMRAIALSLFQAEEDKDGAAHAANQKEVGA